MLSENVIFAEYLALVSLKEWGRVLSLYAHLVIAALTLSTVLLADLSIAAGRYTRAGIHKTARITSALLVALWFSGLLIIYLDTGFDAERLASSSKLLFKLTCVSVLTVNGYVLHRISLPVLTDHGRVRHSHALLLGVTGSISTSHWLMATFIGASTPLARLPLQALLSGYAVAFGLTLLIGIAFTPVIRKRLDQWRVINDTSMVPEVSRPASLVRLRPAMKRFTRSLSSH